MLSVIPGSAVRHHRNAHETYRIKHHVGIDTSTLHVSRVGVRNDNDLVWVGRAANYAAKLSTIREDNTVFISEDVFNTLHGTIKYGGTPKQSMWEARAWLAMPNKTIYRSTWTYRV